MYELKCYSYNNEVAAIIAFLTWQQIDFNLLVQSNYHYGLPRLEKNQKHIALGFWKIVDYFGKQPMNEHESR